MEINQIVKDQIRLNYNECNTLSDEVVGLNIGSLARISFKEDNGVVLKFEPIEGLDSAYIKTFLRGRISSQDCAVYYYKDGVSIFTRYETKAIGVEKLKRSMDIFDRFKNLHNQFSLLAEIISES